MKVEIEPALAKRVERLIAESEGIVPMSAESVVNMAVEAFLDGAYAEENN